MERARKDRTQAVAAAVALEVAGPRQEGVGLACLDELVAVRAAPAGTGAARATATVAGALAPGTVIELVGAAGAGKTEILYHVAARVIAPARWTDAGTGATWAVPGAHGRRAVWVDVDLKLSVRRLDRVLRAWLERAAVGPRPIPPAALDAAVGAGLARLQVFRCCDSLQLVATLHSLAFRADLGLAPGEPLTLFLDGVASLYWEDRDESVTPDGQAFYQRQVVTALRRLQRTIPTAVLATRAALLAPPGGRADLPPRDVMCASWAGLVTHRLWLHQQAASRFLARPLPWSGAATAGWPLAIDASGIRS